jgi:hypothetical protein
MPFDLQTISMAVGSALGVLTILGIVFGWFSKAGRWVYSFFLVKPSVGVIDVPTKTLILIPVARHNSFWWHMGDASGEPVMQIVGDLNVTNISKFGVVLTGARMRKPKATGNAIVSTHDSQTYSSNNVIPVGAMGDLRFDFLVQPPVREKGNLFKADIAIVDQFGNEHWLKGVEFPYLA